MYRVANLKMGDEMLADMESDRSCKSTFVMPYLQVGYNRKLAFRSPRSGPAIPIMVALAVRLGTNGDQSGKDEDLAVQARPCHRWRSGRRG